MPRTISFFECVLLGMGLIVGIIGFFFIKGQLDQDGLMSWNFILAVFVWLLLLLSFVLAALLEDVKQELKILLQDHAEEIKLLRAETGFMKEIAHEQLEEVKMLKEAFNSKKR